MPKRVIFVLAILGVALIGSPTFAQEGYFPGPQRCNLNSANSIPYNVAFFSNVAYMQYIANAEFCANPVDFFTGLPYQTAGLLEPASIGGLGIRVDNFYAQFFTAVHTRPDAGSFHYMTDLGAVNLTISFTDFLNWNASTVTFPGGWEFNTIDNPDPECPTARTQIHQQIPSVGPGFVYLGTLTGCCGSCPAPSDGGMVWQMRGTQGTYSGTSRTYFDAGYEWGAPGIVISQARWYGYLNNAGVTGQYHGGTTYYALATKLGGAPRCQTYSELYDDILNAVIVNNGPSNQTPQSQVGGPYYKNDSGIGGIRNSLWKKAQNSEAAFNRGQYNSAGNGLGALVGEIDAQDGKHLDTDSASDLRLCIRGVVGALGLTLNGGR